MKEENQDLKKTSSSTRSIVNKLKEKSGIELKMYYCSENPLTILCNLQCK